MKYINKFKKYIILGIVILLMLGISIFIYHKYSNDGMNNKNIYNVKYKVYQNGKWSKYSKNGMTIGDKKNPIQNIELKYNKDKGTIYYYVYNNEWSEPLYNPLVDNVKDIYGIKLEESDVLYKKYDVCYRTYNNKDKWLNWSCNGEVNGNKEEPITALEFKLIPKNIIKFDYLKDYNKTLDTKKGF